MAIISVNSRNNEIWGITGSQNCVKLKVRLEIKGRPRADYRKGQLWLSLLEIMGVEAGRGLGYLEELAWLEGSPGHTGKIQLVGLELREEKKKAEMGLDYFLIFPVFSIFFLLSKSPDLRIQSRTKSRGKQGCVSMEWRVGGYSGLSRAPSGKGFALGQWIMGEDSCNGFLPSHRFPKFPMDKCSLWALLSV